MIYRFLLKSYRPHWSIGCFIGILAETFHLFPVFLTNIYDYDYIIDLISYITFPMIFSCVLIILLIEKLSAAISAKKVSGAKA